MASKIHVLDELVANQIAAGEVIERPASVVKELIENSIDANSTRIQIEIVDGGRSSIRIIDNGEGIGKEDVIKAFERHATSKIKEAQDLYAIRTLGFRGEALSSIAAVSKVTIKTRIASEPVGTFLRIEGGEVKEQREIGMAPGTSFLVEDIFFNTPARFKYLKTISTELGQISDIFNRQALAHSEIAMVLSHNGRLVSKTAGTGRLTDTVLSIFGRELVDNLLEVSHEESYVRVIGYITNPVMYRSSRKHQSFFVNGRYIKSSLLGRAVDEAYNDLLPPKRHPIVFLFIDINPIHVDVNVHPAKFEVKFSRPETVTEVIKKTIRKALLANKHLPIFKPIKKINKNKGESFQEKSLFQTVNKEGFFGSLSNNNFESTGIEAGMEAGYSADANTDADTSVNFNNLEEFIKEDASYKEDVSYKEDASHIKEDSTASNMVAERLQNLPYEQKNWDPLYRNEESKKISISRKSYIKTQKTKDAKENLHEGKRPSSFIANLLPIGQIHKTYIIAEGQDGFYIIDQHVAHERVIYEDQMEKFRLNGLPSQGLLIPITLELTINEVDVIINNKELFKQLGFEIENFGGNTVIIRAVPRRIDDRSDKDLFLEIVDILFEEKKADDRANIYKKLITLISCKRAIKAGQYMEQGEMIKLLEDLSKTENPRFCPHGRPILFHISNHDLLKAFHRV